MLQHAIRLLACLRTSALVALVAVEASLSPVSLPMDCVIGLGANLGQCERTFLWTVEQMQKLGTITALSNLYENPAVGGPPQPDYLNGALRLSTALDAEELLLSLQRLELVAGREREVPWGPRTLDLDLLWISGLAIETEHLTVPHPRLVERAFALKPLLEVAPRAHCPNTRRCYQLDLDALGTSSLRLAATASGPPWKWLRQRSRSVSSANVAYP